MTMIKLPALSVEAWAERYAMSRNGRSGPVSISAAIRSARAAVPDIREGDRELSNIIAACAVRHGHAVDFDITTKIPPSDGRVARLW